MVDTNLLEYLESFLTEERKNRFSEVLKYRTKFLTVVAEDVYHLHNASAIVRSCEIFGIQELHLTEGRFGKRIDKNIALGAQQWVDILSYDNTKNCMDSLRDSGYLIVAATPAGKTIDLEDFKLTQKTALFFGTEKEGLTEEVLQSADRYLSIPMVGFTESLNVSVSAAIILQKLTSELRTSNLPWRLSEDEILEKRLDWAKKTIKDADQIISRYHSKSASSPD